MAITRVYSIRGATTVPKDTQDDIFSASVELLQSIMESNGIKAKDIIHIVISTTADITAAYPAKAIRLAGCENIPLFSCLEPPIMGSLPLCIRMMVTASHSDSFSISDYIVKHVYLRGAKGLRPDLTTEKI